MNGAVFVRVCVCSLICVLFVRSCVMRHDLVCVCVCLCGCLLLLLLCLADVLLNYCVVMCDVLRVLLCLCVLFNAFVWFVCDVSREVVWSMVSFVLALCCAFVCCRCCFIVIECFVCESLCDDVWLVFLWCVCVFLRMY